MESRDRVIVALDVADGAAALALVGALGDEISYYKVGLQLFTAAGAEIVRTLKRHNKRVFLDLKFHDIPNTVAGAVGSVVSLGVDMLTIHAAGGRAMIEAAVKAAAQAEQSPVVLAVTVLTSIDEGTLKSTGIADSPQEQVLRLAKLAVEAGAGGLVCSPQEVAAVRGNVGGRTKLVVPGIRPAGSAVGDQARVATPASAIDDGADYLVVGRPITAAADPATAARAIVAEISSATTGSPAR